MQKLRQVANREPSRRKAAVTDTLDKGNNVNWAILKSASAFVKFKNSKHDLCFLFTNNDIGVQDV